MTSKRCVALSALAVATTLGAQSPKHLVVPAAYESNDAISYQWIAGASRDVRQQTLIAANKIAQLDDRRIQAIELRRSAKNEVFQGGAATMTVTLSTSPRTPLTCSSTYAANVGPDAVQVFSGTVTLPTSPVNAGPTIDWTTDNTVRIAFQVPFVYRGGTLCVDIVGAPIAGQNANWWMADAEFEDLSATSTNLGGGCGPYGGPQSEWSYAAERSLIPGGHAQFFAYGMPGNFALAVFGVGTPTGIPMTALGFAVPATCQLHLSSILMMQPLVFVPDPDLNLAHRGGRADLQLQLGYDPSFLGLTCTTQWVDLMTWHTSNAIEWTTASAVPTLGMALNEGHPGETGGLVTVHLAHVMRFEY